MADIALENFTKTLFALLGETFEGPGGNTYLDQGAGLFQTLDSVTAETASHVPAVGAQTVAAHCAHLAYYMRVNHNGVRSRNSTQIGRQVGDCSRSEIENGRNSKGVFDTSMMR